MEHRAASAVCLMPIAAAVGVRRLGLVLDALHHRLTGASKRWKAVGSLSLVLHMYGSMVQGSGD